MGSCSHLFLIKLKLFKVYLRQLIIFWEPFFEFIFSFIMDDIQFNDTTKRKYFVGFLVL